MAGRRLGPDEQALWAQVTATVRPLGKSAPAHDLALPQPSRPVRLDPDRSTPVNAPAKPKPNRPGETLDGGWDRRLRRGIVAPDRTIDLHGHTLASAHIALEQGLADALADDIRILLLVTGRPPRADRDGTARRGLIRASIGDWLAGSRHAARIAAVRNAHPRHGGAGALYIILRRKRSG
ncbi:DNA mismatch repair protein MutS [Sphingomonas oleivorans]|uniref:DNA mismatch repair protein MutS n=1 Tax=Sphingomonas oleivorans TaxID=1735121 RepID=A0A2T5FV25_9SPHN|nr:Smr/MutS family protein [Sphingomonas oleivorans]PTQ08591.1 DNA mismatch repair protein MutS [Sphingomonas oleivorans]